MGCLDRAPTIEKVSLLCQVTAGKCLVNDTRPLQAELFQLLVTRRAGTTQGCAARAPPGVQLDGHRRGSEVEQETRSVTPSPPPGQPTPVEEASISSLITASGKI